jgi:hypothetical protein
LKFSSLITPTLALPHQGGGKFFSISILLPSPLVGEGRVRGEYFNFFTSGEGREPVKEI